MGNPTLIYLRAELNPNEYRCPIVPQSINYLIQYGFIIYVESSNSRIYKDIEYEKVGAIITKDPWYNEKFKSSLIIGLKELSHMEKLSSHKHIYFSHSYKNQLNSEIILKAFAKSNSIIYDYEFLLDKNNKRIIAFGFYAGFIGCCLGLIQYGKKEKNKNINNLYPFKSKKDLLDVVQKYIKKSLKIVVIGSNGRCGSGVINVLDYFNLEYIKLNREDSKNNLEQYDIIFNCIVLEKKLNETWISSETNFSKNLVIVDISCDYNSINNPIKIYNNTTTWKDPVYCYNDKVDVISINNLPSLLPKDSSDEFSEILVKLLVNFNNNSIWKNNEQYYYDIIKHLL